MMASQALAKPGAVPAEGQARPGVNPWFVAITVTLATFM